MPTLQNKFTVNHPCLPEIFEISFNLFISKFRSMKLIDFVFRTVSYVITNLSIILSNGGTPRGGCRDNLKRMPWWSRTSF